MDNSIKGDTTIINKESNINVEIGGKTWLIMVQILFIVLKLTGLVVAEWWIILLPVLIPLAGVVFVAVVAILAAFFSPKFRANIMKDSKEEEDE